MGPRSGTGTDVVDLHLDVHGNKTGSEERKYSYFRGALGEKGVRGVLDLWLSAV